MSGIVQEVTIGDCRLILGDCLSVMRAMPENSVDSIVTDPPYGLEFMGVDWDTFKERPKGSARTRNECGDFGSREHPRHPSQTARIQRKKCVAFQEFSEQWAKEALRVLKPGGHMLAFSGTRTQHRMVCAIEDAGFEIRDMIAWVYASGMPKSFNLDRLSGDKICGCSEPYAHNGTEEKPKCNVRPVRDANVPQAESAQEKRRQVLQPSVQKQGSSASGWQELSGSEIRRGQSCVEGRRNASSPEGELCSSSICESASGRVDHGAQGRLCHGAPLGNGEVDRSHAASDGSCASRGPRSDEQYPGESGAMAGQSKPQAMGTWPVCGWCGLPRVPSGLGTALKPALEPITVARKPLIGTVAANVLEHGTGGINVDASRIECGGEHMRGEIKSRGDGGWSESKGMYTPGRGFVATDHAGGRWPANLIHDGSDDVLALFPQSNGQQGALGPHNGDKLSINAYGDYGPRKSFYPRGDTGSAARFFYCAKASKSERGEGNIHPTVKPLALMRYLCRLVTPSSGVVLDPFLGSGSTAIAAMKEWFKCVGIERERKYFDIACERISNAYRQAPMFPEQRQAAPHQNSLLEVTE